MGPFTFSISAKYSSCKRLGSGQPSGCGALPTRPSPTSSLRSGGGWLGNSLLRERWGELRSTATHTWRHVSSQGALHVKRAQRGHQQHTPDHPQCSQDDDGSGGVT